MSQTYSDIIAILKSLPNRKLKGVRLEIKSEFFGCDWAASEECTKDRYVGVIKEWKLREAVLMIKWDGYQTCKQQ